MAQQEEIVLWIDRRWKSAIEKHLKDENLQEHLENVLDELCNQLPEREYERISRAIQSEAAAQRAEEEAARTYAAYHVTERGQEWYFKTSPGEELLAVGKKLRSYITSEKVTVPDLFIKMFAGGRPITAEEYNALTAVRIAFFTVDDLYLTLADKSAQAPCESAFSCAVVAEDGHHCAFGNFQFRNVQRKFAIRTAKRRDDILCVCAVLFHLRGKAAGTAQPFRVKLVRCSAPELVCRYIFNDAALLKYHHTIRKAPQPPEPVLGDEDSFSRRLPLCDDLPQLPDGGNVQIRGRLIQHEDRRPMRISPSRQQNAP